MPAASVASTTAASIDDGRQRRANAGSERRVNAGTGDQAIAEYWPRHPWRKSASPANGRRKSPTHREWLVRSAPVFQCRQDFRESFTPSCDVPVIVSSRSPASSAAPLRGRVRASGSRNGTRNLLQEMVWILLTNGCAA